MKKKAYKPQRKTKYETFVELFNFWAHRFGLKDIQVVRDNRHDSLAVTESYEDGQCRILYNVKKLARCPYSVIVSAVFHELGHVIMDLPYDTEKQQIKSEFEAERFAVVMLKSFYPEFFEENKKRVLKRFKEKKWVKNCPIHYKAYKMIKEYQK